MTGLSPSTHYYARAYAINSFGIAYGSEVTFTTTDAIAVLTTSASTTNCSDKALGGGNIISDGGDFITAKGVCYSLTAGPTITDFKTTDGIGTGSFVSHLAGLIGNSTYHVRAYATNAFGTYYGSETTFSTLATVSDIDGNVYDVALIGTQLWMADNLKTTRYTDGSVMPNVTDNTAWTNLNTPAYCWYNNDAITYKSNYGALYNWYAANSSNLCPLNWHVPTDAEWSVLVTYLGGNAGTKIKAFGNYTNESNFTALGGGCRTTGFSGLTSNGYFWSSTDAFPDTWARIIDWKFNDVTRFSTQRPNGYSIRCVHD